MEQNTRFDQNRTRKQKLLVCQACGTTLTLVENLKLQYCLHHLIAIIAAIKNAKSDMILWIVDIQQNVLRQLKNARFPKVDTEDKYADCIICIPFNLSLSNLIKSNNLSLSRPH
jgi:hypothetical protein